MTEQSWTTQDRTVNALRESEERFRAIVECSRDAFLILDDQYRIVYVNDRACRASGFSREEFLSRRFGDFLPEDQKSLVVERYRRRQRGEAVPAQYVFTYISKRGDHRHAELRSSIFRNSEGKVWTICHLLDVTERLRMEQALRKSEERLRRITDNMVDLVVQVNLESVIEFVSPSVQRLLGYDLREVVGRRATDLAHEEDRAGVSFLLERGRSDRDNQIEVRIRHRDGRYVWFEVVGTALKDGNGRIVGAILGGRNIEERKRIEEELRQSEAMFRALTESAVFAIFIVQGERIRYVNPAFTRLSGYTQDDLQGLRFWDLIVPEMREIVRERGAARQRGEKVPARYEIRYVTKSGEERIGDFGAAYVEYEGKPALIASLSDVTERKIQEDRLRKSEERYRTIIENIEDGYFEVNLAGDLLHVSDPVLKITRTDRDTMIGMSFRDFTPPESRSKIYQAFYKVFQTGEPLKSLEWETVAPDGGHQHIEVSVSLMRDDAGAPVGFRGIVRDVTERRKREDEIQWMAYHDILTGLPNRALFYDRAAMILAQAKRKHWRFGLMMLDLDRFKEVNDRHGHDAGDRFLVVIAQRLKQALREQDTVARIGGDEFAIILPEMASLEEVLGVGERIVAAFREPIRVAGEALAVSFSVGIALYPDAGEDIDGLMRRADQAMYRIKLQGGGLEAC